MTSIDLQLVQMLHRPEFPRSSAFAPCWILENQMGPNPLWLTEWLCQALELPPGTHSRRYRLTFRSWRRTTEGTWALSA